MVLVQIVLNLGTGALILGKQLTCRTDVACLLRSKLVNCFQEATHILDCNTINLSS